MTLRVGELSVNIVRFVDSYQPGIVECEFFDAYGNRHTLIVKAPYVSVEDLDASSKYPLSGAPQCEVSNRWRDTNDRELVGISIARPCYMESTEGVSEFVVLEAQVSSSSAMPGGSAK